MACVRARVAEDEERLSWRAYVAESLRLAPQNLCLTARWIGSIIPTAPTKDTGDPVEIVQHIMQSAGLHFKAR